MFQPVRVAPSLLSADFTRLAEALRVCEEGGAGFIHVDVMDGHFVPNLTYGPPVIAHLKRETNIPLDVHLMITNAEATIPWYLDAGADMITVHVEACYHLHRALAAIREGGAQCGVVLNPATPVSTLEEIINDVDMVLLMSVNPGYGGQSFIERSVGKVGELVALCERRGAAPLIQVDGGINVETAKLVAAQGADVLVAGNAVFKAPDPAQAIRDIVAAAMI